MDCFCQLSNCCARAFAHEVEPNPPDRPRPTLLSNMALQNSSFFQPHFCQSLKIQALNRSYHEKVKHERAKAKDPLRFRFDDKLPSFEEEAAAAEEKKRTDAAEDGTGTAGKAAGTSKGKGTGKERVEQHKSNEESGSGGGEEGGEGDAAKRRKRGRGSGRNERGGKGGGRGGHVGESGRTREGGGDEGIAAASTPSLPVNAAIDVGDLLA